MRGGLHCAPRLHAALGTAREGLVRASLSEFNTEGEAAAFLRGGTRPWRRKGEAPRKNNRTPENLATLRTAAIFGNLIYFIKYSREENRAFSAAHPNLRRQAPQRVNAARI